VRALRERYRAFKERFGRKPVYYRGRERWTEIPAEFRSWGSQGHYSEAESTGDSAQSRKSFRRCNGGRRNERCKCASAKYVVSQFHSREKPHCVINMSEIFRSTEWRVAKVSEDIEQRVKQAIYSAPVDKGVIPFEITERSIQAVWFGFKNSPLMCTWSQIYGDAQSKLERHVEAWHTHRAWELNSWQIVNGVSAGADELVESAQTVARRSDLKHASWRQPNRHNAADQAQVDRSARLVERDIYEDTVAAAPPRQRLFNASLPEDLRSESVLGPVLFRFRLDPPRDGFDEL
jgi:hypothetical protein